MNDEAIKAYNKVIIDNTRERVNAILKDNDMLYEFDVDPQGYVTVTIEKGDWKHDHIRLKNIMSENGFIYFGYKEFGEETNDDSYSAIHTFR